MISNHFREIMVNYLNFSYNIFDYILITTFLSKLKMHIKLFLFIVLTAFYYPYFVILVVLIFPCNVLF